MKVTIEIEVIECRECPFRKNHYGHGECWDYCSHKDNGRAAYGDILFDKNFGKFPEWCPLMKEEKKFLDN